MLSVFYSTLVSAYSYSHTSSILGSGPINFILFSGVIFSTRIYLRDSTVGAFNSSRSPNFSGVEIAEIGGVLDTRYLGSCGSTRLADHFLLDIVYYLFYLSFRGRLSQSLLLVGLLEARSLSIPERFGLVD